MNNNQQPNISPDYGYIINQQMPQNDKKGVDKRIVIIVVCVILALALLLLSTFIKPSSKNAKTAGNNPAAQPVVSVNEALRAKDYQKAANLVAWVLSDANKNALAKDFEQAASTVDYNTCKITKVTPNGEVVDVQDVCASIDKQVSYINTFTVSGTAGSYYITKVKFEAIRT